VACKRRPPLSCLLVFYFRKPRRDATTTAVRKSLPSHCVILATSFAMRVVSRRRIRYLFFGSGSRERGSWGPLKFGYGCLPLLQYPADPVPRLFYTTTQGPGSAVAPLFLPVQKTGKPILIHPFLCGERIIAIYVWWAQDPAFSISPMGAHVPVQHRVAQHTPSSFCFNRYSSHLEF